MQYIADSSGYLKEVSFGALITCGGTDCTEYTGAVPSGYSSLEAWYLAEADKLYRWKIVSGNLTLDSSAVAPSDLPVADYVVETKTSGLWSYTRWNSGQVEMRYVGQASFASGYSIRYTPVGWKISNVSDDVKSPSIFVTERYLGTNRSVDGVFTAGGMEYISANDNYSFTVYGRRAGAVIASTFYIDILIKGWYS